MSAWHKDFKWSWRGVTVRETGASIGFDKALLVDVGRWLPYFFAEKIRSIPRNIRPTHPISVSFFPSAARPWYLIRMVLMRAGAKLVKDSEAVDAAIFFHDQTETIPKQTPKAKLHLNFDCTDISKSRVAEIFEKVFGYALSVNPDMHNGEMVRKSEHNGAHDGQIISGPANAEAGWVYQRVIDNRTENGTVADLRCPTVGGTIPLVFIKERPTEKRFANMNSSCRLVKPESQFSDTELTLVSQFCKEMKLDWGGLDILRDNMSKQIYIVDVNKTDMGPPLALPIKDKLRSTSILAKALTQMIKGTDA